MCFLTLPYLAKLVTGRDPEFRASQWKDLQLYNGSRCAYIVCALYNMDMSTSPQQMGQLVCWTTEPSATVIHNFVWVLQHLYWKEKRRVQGRCLKGTARTVWARSKYGMWNVYIEHRFANLTDVRPPSRSLQAQVFVHWDDMLGQTLGLKSLRTEVHVFG